jgi:hypothetical protein
MAHKLKVAIIGGSGFYKLDSLQAFPHCSLYRPWQGTVALVFIFTVSDSQFSLKTTRFRTSHSSMNIVKPMAITGVFFSFDIARGLGNLSACLDPDAVLLS